MESIANLRKRSTIIENVDPTNHDSDSNNNNIKNTSTGNRLPLKETNNNIPSPPYKKAKLNKQIPNNSHISHNKPNLPQPSYNKHFQIHQLHNEQHQHQQEKSTNVKSARLVGEELRSWQISWRKIMKESVVYFDTQGYDSSNQLQNLELKKAQKALKNVGCDISPFFERQVSIIISRRPFNPSKDYPSSDIFHEAIQYKIKVWDYDKVFRFLKNLGASDSPSHNSNTTTNHHSNILGVNNNAINNGGNGNLSNLLKEERIFGSTDRDPNAKRDDLHYLDKNYLYVYDLSQNVRPIAIREWSGDDYPSIHLTLDGKCPFIPDNSENSDRKKLRRNQKFAATKEYRELLKKITSDIMNNTREGMLLNTSGFTGTSTSTDIVAEEHDEIVEEEYQTSNDNNQEIQQQEIIHENDTVVVQNTSSSSTTNDKKTIKKYSFKAPPAPLLRNSSCIQPPIHNSNSNCNSKFYDVAASGYNGASNAMQFSMDSTLNSVAASHQQGNGLGPMVSQVPSKNINNLKRRIFFKKQKQKPSESSSKHTQSQVQSQELKPGYCENCRIKYDHFDDHINSNRHRNFAYDDRNFKDIDDLITVLNESKSMGYVTSNGDYSYAT